VSGQFHAPAALSPEKQPLFPIELDARWAPRAVCPSWQSNCDSSQPPPCYFKFYEIVALKNVAYFPDRMPFKDLKTDDTISPSGLISSHVAPCCNERLSEIKKCDFGASNTVIPSFTKISRLVQKLKYAKFDTQTANERSWLWKVKLNKRQNHKYTVMGRVYIHELLRGEGRKGMIGRKRKETLDAS